MMFPPEYLEALVKESFAATNDPTRWWSRVNQQRRIRERRIDEAVRRSFRRSTLHAFAGMSDKALQHLMTNFGDIDIRAIRAEYRRIVERESK